MKFSPKMISKTKSVTLVLLIIFSDNCTVFSVSYHGLGEGYFLLRWKRIPGRKLQLYPDRNLFFLLAGHKVDFIAPHWAIKSTFWPASRKKIVCNAGKTFILLVWLLPSLCSGIKLHTRKINFFFPSCTMYYCGTKSFF